MFWKQDDGWSVVHVNCIQDTFPPSGYDLRTVRDYGKVIEGAGFREVEAVDMTKTFISVLTTELKYFEPTREAFIKVSTVSSCCNTFL